MSPYVNPVTNIKDISKYFRKDDHNFSMVFIGETLELRIPKSFQKHGALIIGDNVTTIGVMDMIFDGTYQASLNILASITIEPTDISNMTYEGLDYLVLHLKHGDTFMTSYRVIQDPHIVYILWTEFITGGGLIYTFDYQSLLKLFEHVHELTGQGIGVSRSVYEGIIAHISRDSDNISKQYRLTSMEKPMKLIALKSVSQGPSGSLARLNGSYFRDEGLTAALNYQVDQQQPFENLLRGLDTIVEDRTEDSFNMYQKGYKND